MLRRHPSDWIDRWFDVGDVRRVDALSQLCPCETVNERRALTFDRSIADRLRRPPLINASTVLVCGYFQSWKYVSAVNNELRQRLRWKPTITSAVSRYNKTKLESASLGCKSHRSKTANIKILSANSTHIDASDHISVSQWPVINVKASFCA